MTTELKFRGNWVQTNCEYSSQNQFVYFLVISSNLHTGFTAVLIYRIYQDIGTWDLLLVGVINWDQIIRGLNNKSKIWFEQSLDLKVYSGIKERIPFLSVSEIFFNCVSKPFFIHFNCIYSQIYQLVVIFFWDEFACVIWIITL